MQMGATIAKLIDGAIEAVAPGWACARAQARETLKASAAVGSESSEFTVPMGDEVHPDNDVMPDSAKQRRRCSLAYYNNDLVHGITDSQVRQVIGTLSVQAMTPSSQANSAIENEYRRLFDASLPEQLELAVRHMLIDGGVVPYRIGRADEPFRLGLLPYRQIKTPGDQLKSRIRDGFRYDEQGEQVEVFYETEETSVDQVYATGKYSSMRVWSHLAMPRLIGQTKGLSWFQAAITRLEMVNRWMRSLLRSAELHTYIVALVKSNATTTTGIRATMPQATKTDGDGITSYDRQVAKFAEKHRFLFLPEKADYKVVQANAPVVADFLIWQCRLAARALGTSYERLTYDLSNTSFSSTKFGDRDDMKTVTDMQMRVRKHLLIPMHRDIVAGLVLRREIKAEGAFARNPSAYLAVGFTLPGRPPVDESKAEAANEKALSNRTASRTSIAASKGQDPEQIENELIVERERYFKKAVEMWKRQGFDEKEARALALQEIMAKPTPASDPQPKPDDADEDEAAKRPKDEGEGDDDDGQANASVPILAQMVKRAG